MYWLISALGFMWKAHYAVAAFCPFGVIVVYGYPPYLPFPYDLLVVAFSLFLVVKARYSEVNPPENVCGTKHREKATHK